MGEQAFGEEAFSCTARVSHEKAIDTWAHRILLGAAITTVGSCGAAPASAWLLLVASVGLLVFLGSLLALTLRPRGKVVPATAFVRAEPGLVVVTTGAARYVLEPARIAAGWREEPHDVAVALDAGPEITLRGLDAARAKRVCDALRIGVASRVLRMPLRTGAGGLVGRLGALVGVLSLVPAWLFVGLILGIGLGDVVRGGGSVAAYSIFVSAFAGLSAILWALVRMLRRREVVVGADGLHLPDSGSFVPWARVSHAEACLTGVRVRRHDGKSTVLALEGDRRAPAFVRAQGALIERIEAALRASRDLEGPELALLDRNGQPSIAWKSALDALRSGEGNYRVLAVTDDELERVISDAKSPPERRVGAAYTLGRRSKARADAHVRVAVAACADEGLTVALERAADGDLDVDYVERAARRR